MKSLLKILGTLSWDLPCSEIWFIVGSAVRRGTHKNHPTLLVELQLHWQKVVTRYSTVFCTPDSVSLQKNLVHGIDWFFTLGLGSKGLSASPHFFPSKFGETVLVNALGCCLICLSSQIVFIFKYRGFISVIPSFTFLECVVTALPIKLMCETGSWELVI